MKPTKEFLAEQEALGNPLRNRPTVNVDDDVQSTAAERTAGILYGGAVEATSVPCPCCQKPVSAVADAINTYQIRISTPGRKQRMTSLPKWPGKVPITLPTVLYKLQGCDCSVDEYVAGLVQSELNRRRRSEPPLAIKIDPNVTSSLLGQLAVALCDLYGLQAQAADNKKDIDYWIVAIYDCMARHNGSAAAIGTMPRPLDPAVVDWCADGGYATPPAPASVSNGLPPSPAPMEVLGAPTSGLQIHGARNLDELMELATSYGGGVRPASPAVPAAPIVTPPPAARPNIGDAKPPPERQFRPGRKRRTIRKLDEDPGKNEEDP